MKTVLASLGTSGDFEPMLALAVAMRDRGHSPVLANSPDFEYRAQQHGIAFVPVGPSIEQLGLTRCLQEILALESPAEQARAMIARILPFVPQMVDALDKVCEDADLLVCLPYQLAGFMSHERTGVPYVAWSFSPFGAMPGGGLAQATADLINRTRQDVGLESLADPFAEATARSRLALFAASSHVFRRPRSWPAHYHLTGYFFLNETWRPDLDLLNFIEAGPRPVVVTFGSMRHPDSARVSEMLVEAIERVGCRAVIQAGWSGLDMRKPSPNIFLTTGFIAHGWLFRQAACVVHHGAAGTTAAALRAGVPSVIVPHALDQPLWAELMRGCGAAQAVIPFKQLNAERLAAAIDDVLSFKGDGRLSRLTEQVRLENGVDRAITLMEAEWGQTL